MQAERKRMRRISQILAFTILVFLQAAAADLPAWTDDSDVVLRSESHGQDQFKLTAAIFHSIDAATDAQFTFTIEDEHGLAVRVLRGARTFVPGQNLEFSAIWDRRDESGALLPATKYTVNTTVEMTANAGAIQMAEPASVARPGRTTKI